MLCAIPVIDAALQYGQQVSVVITFFIFYGFDVSHFF